MKSVLSPKLFAWAFILVPCVSLAQQPHSGGELGLPLYFDHFSPRDYGAHPQNWCITQDSRGVIYVGNYDGILAYDGSTWQLVRTPTNTTVRSLAADDSGNVFVGLQGDFGFVTADSSGQIEYNSLAEHLEEQFHDFRDVWSTHVIGTFVYFQTSSHLFRWDGKSFKVWTSENGYHTSFIAEDEIYVRERHVGIMKVSGELLSPVTGGEAFAEIPIFMLEKHTSGALLIGTQGGFYLLDLGSAERMETEIDDWIKNYRLYYGTSVGSEYYALAFLDGGGLVIIDSQGNRIDSFMEGDGLADGWVNHVYIDRQEGLWLALNNKGIVHMDALSALTRFDHRNGLEGVISDIRRVDDEIYAATTAGLYRLDGASNPGSRAAFHRIPAIVSTSSLLAVESGLLASTHAGLVHIRADTSVRHVVSGTFFSMAQSSDDPDLVFLGSKTGITTVRYDGAEWVSAGEILTLGEEVFSLVESLGREIWISTRKNAVFRAKFSSEWEIQELEEYEFPHGGIDGQVSATSLDDQVLFATEGGILYPEEISGVRKLRFIPDNAPNSTKLDTLLYFKLTERGQLWKVYPDRVEVSQSEDDRYITTVPPLLSELKWGKPVRVSVDSSGVAWISSGNMVVRYDPSLAHSKTYDAPFPALVRRITTIDSNGLLFGGAFADERGRLTSEQDASLIPQLAFEHNALRFEYTLPSYNDAGGNEYQYFLEGKDKDWSAWTSESSKNYTNLSEGTYTFHIRGRNAQGYVSSENTYDFMILPPWYRSVWAYGFYLLGFGGAALFARQHRRMVIENKKAREQAKELVKEREVNEKLNDLNRRLKLANESLIQADRLKDEFLANTSHELRTPLTGILGCAAILAEEVTDDQKEFIEMIDQNGNRLLHTLDSLLELARLRAGLLELEFENVDIGLRANAVAATYRPVVDRKALKLNVNVDGDVRAWVDDHCLQSVLHHLIGNAVKFTDSGMIDVSIKRDAELIHMTVEDTGIGIEDAFLPFLFDEFKQESTGLTRSYEGNGLGLAVTSRILDLMGGAIEVTSKKGVGTTFSVTFPIDNGGKASMGDGPTSGARGVQFEAQGEMADRAAA